MILPDSEFATANKIAGQWLEEGCDIILTHDNGIVLRKDDKQLEIRFNPPMAVFKSSVLKKEQCHPK